VLWLNTSLTVRAGQAASHSKIGWETFTRAVLQVVLSRPNHKGVVFLAWGAHAQKAIPTFDKVRLAPILLSMKLINRKIEKE
jgi:uracil-DNA glycosylase